MNLSDFAEPTEQHDRAIQMALRETDSSVLADFLVSVPVEQRDIVYRNMSQRACSLLVEDIARREAHISPERVRKAEQFFLQRLSRFLNYTDREHAPLGDAPPPLDLSNDEALAHSLVLIARYERAKGTLALTPMVESVTHPIARKGLQMTVDGWDAVEKRAILERMKQTYLAATARTIDILIAGIDGLGGEDHPLVIEERLNAFLPSRVMP